MKSIAKRVSKRIKNSLCILMVFALSYHVNAQSFADLGTVWQKNDYTTAQSTFENITKQTDGTYLASGWVNNGRQVGYIVHFNESGVKLKDWVVTPPNVSQWTEGGTTAVASLRYSFITSTGDIMAFGKLLNKASTQKGYSLSGVPAADNDNLQNGIWIVKISGTTNNLLINKLDRGNSLLVDVIMYKPDQYLITGFDYQLVGSHNFLFRVYKTDGTWAYDNYTGGKALDYNWARDIHKLSNGNFAITSAFEVREYNGTTFDYVKTYATSLTWGQGCVTEPTATPSIPAGKWTEDAYWSMKSDGGFWATGRMGGVYHTDKWNIYGSVFYEKDASNTLLQCSVIQNASTLITKVYRPPLLLPGSTTNYVGTISDNGVNKMYGCTDITPGFTITDGPATPYNTVINTTSHTDGFFSCGRDNVTGRAAIAKLSTCANFKASPVSDIYVPYTNSISIAQAINYVGAKATTVSNVKYRLETKVLKGKIDNKAAGQVLETVALRSVANTGTPAAGIILDLNRTYALDPNLSHAEIEVTLTIQDNFVTAGTSQHCDQTYVFKIIASKANSDLFSDDVWFFGQNTGASEGNDILGTAFTSKGIIFKKDGGIMKPTDASGVSKVNSWENSLSISTPACNGAFIYYAQHTMLYNTNHANMLNGAISGHTSTGDGLASAYLGDNKYFFASVSTVNQGNLNYNIIDMSKDHGLGEKLAGGVVDASGLVGEGIEMLPVVGTYNQYWLVYYLRAPHYTIVVKRVDGTNPSAPVVTDVSTLNIATPLGANYNTWRLQANPEYTMLAMNSSGSNAANCNHHFFNFNPLTGAISFNRSLSTRPRSYSSYSSYVFHKNFLYIAESENGNHTTGYYIYQYNLNDWTLNSSFKVTHTTATMGWHGGGMKMGPDGKIYFIRQASYYSGVINNPDLSLTAPGNVNEDGFRHKYNGMGIAMSTGLTPPWINPPTSNTSPNAVKDVVTATTRYGTLVVKPLANDTDNGGQATLNLNGAEFANPADASKGTLTWSAANKDVTFVPNPLHNFVNGEKIRINYIVKDMGTPVALCDEGEIEITWAFLIANNDFITVTQGSTHTIPILINDSIPLTCTPAPTLTLLAPLAKGAASLVSNKVQYTPATSFQGLDTVRYEISCGATQKDTATVYISVLPKGNEIVDVNCVTPTNTANWALSKQSLGSSFTNWSSLTAGDLDGDGLPEIVTQVYTAYSWAAPGPYHGHYGKTLKIQMSGGGQQTINLTNHAAMCGTVALGRIKTEDGDQTLIFVAETNGYLYAYNIAGELYWKKYRANGASDNSYTTAYNGNIFTMQSPGIADFDGDGYAELYINNKIFDAATGKRICTTAGALQGFSHGWYEGTNYCYQSIVSVADVNNNGKLELLIGNEAWGVTINRASPYSPTGTMLKSHTATVPTGYQADGHTFTADFDADGYADVLVSTRNQTSGNIELYIWSPIKGKILASLSYNNATWAKSAPAIGDIDGDGKPEIVISGLTNMYAYKYDGTATLQQKWSIEHGDLSHAAGCSLFDLDNDGVDEIIHRGSANLRIIDGRSAVPVEKFTIASASGTLVEYPLIIDYDGDGSAEIVVATSAAIDIYKPTVGRWAATRKVWNQYAYNGLQVNDDLSTRIYPPSPASVFVGLDGIAGTPDDKRPYNGAMRQLSRTGANGVTYNYLPEAEMRNVSFIYDIVKDSLIVTATVRNNGEIGFTAPFKITTYKNTIGSLKYTYTYSKIIGAHDSAVITFGIPKFKLQWTPFTDIIIQANDNGSGGDDQMVCKNNKRAYRTGALIASDDRVLVFKNSTGNVVDLLKNDIYATTCTPTPVITPANGPKHGTYTQSGGKITYKPNADYLGQDTIVYTITCGSETSTAKVIINVVSKPDNISEADCYVDPPAIEFKIKELARSTTEISSLTNPVVGDIDNDGEIEMLVVNAPGTTLPHNAIYIYGFKQATNQLYRKYQISVPTSDAYAFSPIAIAKVDGNTYASIFYASFVDRTLRRFDLVGGAFVQTWSTVYTDNSSYRVVTPNVVDLMGNGRTQICILDKVIDTKSGRILANGGLIPATGLSTSSFGRFGHTAGGTTWESSLIVADIDNDGIKDVIGGDCVYGVNLVDFDNLHAGNTFALKRQASNIGHVEIGDGGTAIIDIDNDGLLEVVVAGPITNGFSTATNGMLYIYNPRTGDVIHSNAITNLPRAGGSMGPSRPFCGDIDGDGYSEICVTAALVLKGYKYNRTTKQLVETWSLPTTDGSAATTLTMFDFAQDKSARLVYRDEKQLRIIKAGTPPTFNVEAFFNNVESATVNEYPVVADINNDGAAEIILTAANNCRNPGNTDWIFQAELRVYASNGKPWAPARPVWNQPAYNAVNVNNDLTIPRHPLSPATVFPGKDGVLGTADDVRPYNGFLQQQTSLDKNGNTLWLTPQADIRKQPVFHYDVAKDSMTISVTVHNIGDAAFQNPFKITAYKDIVGGAPKHTYSYAGVINAGDSAVITFGIPKFKLNWTPFTDIIIRANDKGNGYNDQLVCDSMKRDFKTGTVIASDDRVLVFKNSTGNIIKILENDIRPDACVTPSITTISGPKHGTVDGGTYYTYKPNTDYLGQDTIVYKIDCGGKTAIAKVVINVVSKPDNISEADCYIDPPSIEWSFKKIMSSPLDKLVDDSNMVQVGDINNDGKIDLVTLAVSDVVVNSQKLGQYVDKLYIFEIDNGAIKHKQTISGYVMNRLNTPYAIAKVNGNNYASIFITTSYYGNKPTASKTQKLIKFDYNPTTQMYAEAWANNPTYSAVYYREMAQPMIADINGDGVAEVIVLDKVYNAQTGALIANGGFIDTDVTLNYTIGDGKIYKYDNLQGFGFGGHESTIARWLPSETDPTKVVKTWSSIMSVADIDNDGVLEVIGGNKVYKVDVAAGTFKLYQTANVTGRTDIMDGPTAVADMDGDGYLDVIVTGNNRTVSGGSLYIWNPRTGAIMNSNVINNLPTSAGEHSCSVPFVGDIDGDGELEVALTAYLKTYAFDYNKTTQQLVPKWNITTNDGSVATGITMFDFDQDKSQELIYRDMTHLRILNGSNGTDKITKIACTSTTANEYPVVADINEDGAAEIIVIGGITDPYQANYQPVINVFASASSNNKWAPARPVWNQYSYNAVNVNDDLTIPRHQLNPATVFPGKDGVLGTADDVRPYNAFLQQQTSLDKNGNTLWLTPQADIRKQPVFHYDVAKDSMTISVTVHNIGDAAFQNPFKITAYKDVVGGTPKHTYSYAGVINAGDSAVITFGIPKFKLNWTPFTDIIIRANDKGNGYNDQLVCDSMKRDFKTGTVIASDDRVLVFGNLGVNKIEVLKNDIYPASCISPAVTIIPGHEPKQGTITIAGGIIHYTPKVGYKVNDTLKYRLTCGANTSDATVYIRIGDKPDNIIDPEACLVVMPTINFEPKIKWEVTGPTAVGGGAHQKSLPLVGDLDGDGFPEVVVCGKGTGYADFGKINVFDGRTGSLKASLNYPFTNGGWANPAPMVLVDADANGWGEIVLVSNASVYSYEAAHNASGDLILNLKWGPKSYDKTNTASPGEMPTPFVVDFDGDGKAEIVVNNCIFNGTSGALLGRTASLTTAYNGTSYGEVTFATAADMDGDGLPEYIAGAAVYKIKLSPFSSTPLYKNTTIGDGFTTVADLDLDGKLEVIVANIQGGNTKLHIWNPVGNIVKSYTVLDGADAASPVHSFPFIGDIDGKNQNGYYYPEICLTTVKSVRAFRYNPTSKIHEQKWFLPTSDNSGGTGITLFDFDNNGVSELVYRDETYLRIINGSVDAIKPTDLSSFKCVSGTAWEYPVIANLDGSGSSQILITGVTGDPVTQTALETNYLRAYEGKTTSWAPTRKVWNSLAYEPLRINENLTLPKFSFPKNTVFNSRYPYNGSLIQVPIVDDNFDPVLLAADPGTTTSDISIERLNVSTARVWITISNHGAKYTNISLPVTLYINDATVAANKIASKPVGVGIAPGAKYKMYIDMPVSKLQVAQKIVVRIQDDGTKYPADGSYLDCNYTNNVVDKTIFYAVDDYVALFTNTTVSTPVFANDKRAACTTTPLSKFDTIPNSGLKQGSLVFSQAPDTSFVYTSKSPIATTDSVTYYIKCGTDSAVAKVYYLQIKPNSQAYTACPNAVVTVGVNAITGVTFRWYATATGSTVLITGLTTTVTKDASLSQSVWVEAEYKGVKYSRIEVKVSLASGCGGAPQACAKDGTVIFKEDFDSYDDGNNPLSTLHSKISLGTKTNYKFFNGITHPTNASSIVQVPHDGEYSLQKNRGNYTSWNFLDDHTSPSDPNIGRAMLINADFTPGIFYSHTISDLCSGTFLNFSAWLVSFGAGIQPNLTFTISDPVTNNILATYYTSNIPLVASPVTNWKHYGFEFELPLGITSLKLEIKNNAQGGNGNDFAMDDIEIRFCAPAVVTLPAKDTVICLGSNLDIQLGSEFIDDGTFGANIDYRWEFKAQESVIWDIIAGTGGSSNNGKVTVAQSKHTIASATATNTGDYRFIIAATGNINSVNCRAVSESFHVLVAPPVRAADIRVQVCPDATPGSNLNLSSYLHVIHPQLDWNVKWGNVSATPYSPVVNGTDPKGGVSLAFATGTHTYKYKMENKCGVDSARMYITSLNTTTIQMPPQRVVICREMAENIHINQILGVEARGMITSNLTPAIANDHILNVANPSPFAGAVVFNGKTAYDDPRIIPDPYKGDVKATRVVFTYTANNASCLTQKVYTVELIITTNILN